MPQPETTPAKRAIPGSDPPAGARNPAPGKRRLRCLTGTLAVLTFFLAIRVFMDPEGFVWIFQSDHDESLLTGEGSGPKSRIIEQGGKKLLWGGPSGPMALPG